MATDTDEESYIDKRNKILRAQGVDYDTTRRAWFAMSHLLLDDGAKVVDMGCGDGLLTFIMAALYPNIHFTGLDQNRRQINKARQTYDLPNLEFKVGNVSGQLFEKDSLDAIINTFILHEIYSKSHNNEAIVTNTLEQHFKMLKNGGSLFIQDYARPPPDEFVLMEMPDTESLDDTVTGLSEPDLLVWYSEHARPRNDPGFAGFFLEELPPRFPNRRLFRLPYKWAYEFLMRKDDRTHWEKELPIEYTFFTPREFQQTLARFGARLNYSGPHWDDDFIQKNFEDHFLLFTDDETPLGHPPTSFITVATKLPERQSLQIEERRPSRDTKNQNLTITTMRNEKTGALVDVVQRKDSFHEILPYRIDEEGRLKVYLHEGVARSIANAVPRSGLLIDGRRWSGHMIEPITVSTGVLDREEKFDVKSTATFAKTYLGLKPEKSALLQNGPDYYPSPDYIDEKIHTFYLQVKKSDKPLSPKSVIDYTGRFHAKGIIKEFHAQQILNAITVGMIPNARLELQILALFEHLKIKSENWSDQRVFIEAKKVGKSAKLRELLSRLGDTGQRFKSVKGTAGQLRPVHSTFVEEGRNGATLSGLASQDVDFVVHNEETINTAVVLPITKNLKGDLHAGIQVTHLPIPQRFEGKSATVDVPSFNLPPHINNTKQAKKFIAEKFGILPQMVIKLGESYYSHMGVTPQKIHPFAITSPPSALDAPNVEYIPLFQIMLMYKRLNVGTPFITVLFRAFKAFHEEIKYDLARRVSPIVKERFEHSKTEWSLPLEYHPMPVEKPRPKAPEIKVKAPDPAPQPTITQKIKNAFPISQPFHGPKSPAPQAPEASGPEHTLEPDLSVEKALDLEDDIEELIEALEHLNEPKPEL